MGDAAHLHSPAGAQGMNTGIGDAINLAWKLAAVIKNQASEQLLESYQIERRAFAEKLVKSTDRVFSLITAEGALAAKIRTQIAPYQLSKIYNNAPLSHFIFRIISQLGIHYQHSPLSQEKTGKIHAGDRLPWIQQAQSNNFESLKQINWQIKTFAPVDVPDHTLSPIAQNRHGYKFAWWLNCYALTFPAPRVNRHYSTTYDWQNSAVINVDVNRYLPLHVVPEISPDFQFVAHRADYLFE